MIIVLKTTGKRDDIETYTVLLFDDLDAANKYCKNNTSEYRTKYWKHACIIEQGKEYAADAGWYALEEL